MLVGVPTQKVSLCALALAFLIGPHCEILSVFWGVQIPVILFSV